MGFSKRNSSYPQFADHCFTGEYPIKPMDANTGEIFSNKLSYLPSRNKK